MIAKKICAAFLLCALISSGQQAWAKGALVHMVVELSSSLGKKIAILLGKESVTYADLVVRLPKNEPHVFKAISYIVEADTIPALQWNPLLPAAPEEVLAYPSRHYDLVYLEGRLHGVDLIHKFDGRSQAQREYDHLEKLFPNLNDYRQKKLEESDRFFFYSAKNLYERRNIQSAAKRSCFQHEARELVRDFFNEGVLFLARKELEDKMFGLVENYNQIAGKAIKITYNIEWKEDEAVVSFYEVCGHSLALHFPRVIKKENGFDELIQQTLYDKAFDYRRGSILMRH